MYKQPKSIFKITLAALFCSMFPHASGAESLPDLWGAPIQAPESLHVVQTHREGYELRYVTLHPINFDYDKALLNRQGQLALEAAVDYLHSISNLRRIIIEGHTDSLGYIAYNQNLSQRRAQIVRDFLTVNGVNPDLIAPIAFGETSPSNDNSTMEGRLRNRKVSIHAVYYAP